MEKFGHNSDVLIYAYNATSSKIVKKRKNHNEEICPHELNPVKKEIKDAISLLQNMKFYRIHQLRQVIPSNSSTLYSKISPTSNLAFSGTCSNQFIYIERDKQ